MSAKVRETDMFNLTTLKEIMIAYDTYRACWIEKKGNDNGFDEWFSLQIEVKAQTQRQAQS